MALKEGGVSGEDEKSSHRLPRDSRTDGVHYRQAGHPRELRMLKRLEEVASLAALRNRQKPAESARDVRQAQLSRVHGLQHRDRRSGGGGLSARAHGGWEAGTRGNKLLLALVM